jgi:hypothetical protein
MIVLAATTVVMAMRVSGSAPLGLESRGRALGGGGRGSGRGGESGRGGLLPPSPPPPPTVAVDRAVARALVVARAKANVVAVTG